MRGTGRRVHARERVGERQFGVGQRKEDCGVLWSDSRGAGLSSVLQWRWLGEEGGFPDAAVWRGVRSGVQAGGQGDHGGRVRI